MANQHKHPVRGIRGIDDERTAAFDQAAKEAGSDRSAITGQLWDWFAGRPGAKLPKRGAQHLHHRDGDPRNNDPGNLELREQPEA